MNRDRFTEQELLKARERNNRGKYKNDTVWESNQCGSFTIIGRFDSNYLYIKFINTDAIYVKQIPHIRSGQVKDLYARTVCNKGFVGEGEYSFTSHKVLYNRWTGMLHRVYSDNRPTYKDCSVSEEWLNFQNFSRDIEEIMKEQRIDSLKDYEIDKDIKSNSTKIYSKDTVSLITKTENVKEMNSRIHNTVYIAEHIKTGKQIEFSNQMQFAREYGLYNSNISKVLNGKLKTTGGWKFYRKEKQSVYKTKEELNV